MHAILHVCRIMKHEEEHEGQWGGEEEQAVRVAQAQSALRHET